MNSTDTSLATEAAERLDQAFHLLGDVLNNICTREEEKPDFESSFQGEGEEPVCAYEEADPEIDDIRMEIDNFRERLLLYIEENSKESA